jgi:hypothetical protein
MPGSSFDNFSPVVQADKTEATEIASNIAFIRSSLSEAVATWQRESRANHCASKMPNDSAQFSPESDEANTERLRAAVLLEKTKLDRLLDIIHGLLNEHGNTTKYDDFEVFLCT